MNIAAGKVWSSRYDKRACIHIAVAPEGEQPVTLCGHLPVAPLSGGPSIEVTCRRCTDAIIEFQSAVLPAQTFTTGPAS